MNRASVAARRPTGTDQSTAAFLLKANARDRRWQGEDAVGVGHRQEIGLALREPCLRRGALGVPVAACVIGDSSVIAVVAAHDMAAGLVRRAAEDRRERANPPV